MKLTIDTTGQTLTRRDGVTESIVGLFTKEAFEAISHEWLRVGWSLAYYHNFCWMGMPILQLPEDLMRLQEVIWAVRPEVIVETGVYEGGSAIFHASLLEAMRVENGRVIGIDIHIPLSVKQGVEGHPLASRITLLEGSSVDPAIHQRVRDLVGSASRVLVILDSDHSRKHVAEELEVYAPLVTLGSYIVATDGITKDLWDVPRALPEWKDDNPFQAANEFAARHPEFLQQQPPWPVRAEPLSENVTYWPGAWLKRMR